MQGARFRVKVIMRYHLTRYAPCLLRSGPSPLVFEVWCFKGLGFWVSGFGFWVLGFGFWVLGFGFWVSGFGFWDLVLGFRV